LASLPDVIGVMKWRTNLWPALEADTRREKSKKRLALQC